MKFPRRTVLLFCASLVGCGDENGMESVPGSTVRVGQPEPKENTQNFIDVLLDAEQCESVSLPPDGPGGIRQGVYEACLPYVNRGTGEVRVSFQVLGDDGRPKAMPRLDEESLDVAHKNRSVQNSDRAQNVRITPMDPVSASQLFLVLIDGSASMNEPAENPRIERLRKALLSDRVVEGFFPSMKGGTDFASGVVLAQFAGSSVVPIGDGFDVLRGKKRYRQIIRNELRSRGGYTNLYDAIVYATSHLLEEEALQGFMGKHKPALTVVVLTDGFNNESRSDVCGTNAKRLTSLLAHLKEVRFGEAGASLPQRPQVFTVGMGKGFWKRFKVKSTRSKDPFKAVAPKELCGPFRQRQIDGQLENRGIDNASLKLIADAGGGNVFMARNVDELAKAFSEAAAERYSWFQLQYRVDPSHLRREFSTLLALKKLGSAETRIPFFPSAWMDGPPGVYEMSLEGLSQEERTQVWTRPVSLGAIATLVMPLLGILFGMVYLSPAGFNAWRAVFRSKPQGPSPSSAPQTPAENAAQPVAQPPTE